MPNAVEILSILQAAALTADGRQRPTKGRRFFATREAL